uniref:SHSP domain-containing protein n=1 Tax=Plectus sambesii TaxID=2011161 RepID=A0A914WZ16_9BILA
MFLVTRPCYRNVSPSERLLDNFFNDALMDVQRCYEHPYWTTNHQNQSALAGAVDSVQDEKDKFAVSIDVQHFAPNEVKVTTSGRQLVIEGKHEEKSDEHGQIQRHFIRKYALPKEVNVKNVVSHLSKEGVLTVSAPKNTIEGPTVRTIPILPASEETKPVEEARKE